MIVVLYSAYGAEITDVVGVASGPEAARRLVEDHEDWGPPEYPVYWDDDGPYRMIGRGMRAGSLSFRASLDWRFEHFVVH